MLFLLAQKAAAANAAHANLDFKYTALYSIGDGINYLQVKCCAV